MTAAKPTHVVIVAGRVGPVLLRFSCPVQFSTYVRGLIESRPHWPRLWVSPFELRLVQP